jgi:hypothetical protein
MGILKDIMVEMDTSTFRNWVVPPDNILAREFKVEHELKGLNYFKDLNHFIDAVKGGKIISVDDNLDRKILRRSRTSTFDSLFRLISTYRSYPEFRNEKTLQAIYDGFKENKPMEMPIILNLPNNKLSILSGNTRMDIAFQLGIKPRAILINVDSVEK